MHDTIVAIATAHGVSSISIIRLSGQNALEIAQKISFSKTFSNGIIPPREAILTSLYNATNDLIDQAIMIYFAAPKSFTGEDIVEFQCHGGMVVAQEVLDTATVYGARLAEPGEFSKRAFLNGKIDLTKAEATAKLIEAKSVDAAKILARQLKGELKDFVDESRESLLRALAYSEVMIDYAEEDIAVDIVDTMVAQLSQLQKQLRRIVEVSHRRRGLIEGFRVAIIGKPNVGKSSLLNALLSYERAIVSDIAGTTRDTIEEQMRIGSHIIRLVDTAGIREARDSIEKIGIERSMHSLNDADIVIVLFDGSQLFDEDDQQIISLIEQTRDKHLIVAINKSDLTIRFESQLLADFDPIFVSAKKGFERLTDRLREILDGVGEGDELMLISARQIEAVEQAATAIEDAQTPLQNGELEFFSYYLQDAVKAISSISKPYDSEEILDKMFGEFCLGK
ncbi:MAG: tRNA uridine-5-carboxymethylaminomethyl(34) synthesis GTPase MnmE [Epsilonproteobacteria bacterium]|nr:MAG: tRNA uridine-5-carboxymethylaminomethyl(34) synthesis GTPase MnmE [Campylobacterota bacterium]